MKDGSGVVRINPLSNGKYGIGSDGVINANALTKNVSITRTKNYPWGKVTLFSDGSAMVENSKMNMFVRNSADIKDKYISDNKVSYLESSKNVGNVKLNYYYDGTIEVIKNGKSYVVRSASDLNITGSDVTFKNNNEAYVYSTKRMNDGYVIDYYTDGGAIIRDGNKTLSVRKSNSIIIKNNKIYEIVDNIYVNVSRTRGNVTYYTNGSAVVTNYNGNIWYVPENSNIKFRSDGGISTLGNDTEHLVRETTIDDENVKIFEVTAVVTTDKYIAIVPKDGIIFDVNGKIKELVSQIDESGMKTFKIDNNTNEDLKYRVVIEQSPRTTLDVEYVRFQLSTNSTYIKPTKLNKNVWTDDNIAQSLGAEGVNYILIDSTIYAQSSENVSLMLWTDYDTIPNSQMDKYFYGTIKVYAWTEE